MMPFPQYAARLTLWAALALVCLSPLLMAGPPGKDLTEPAHDSVETWQAHPDRTDGGNGFVCGQDAGAGGYLRMNPTAVPCPQGTKAIHVKVQSGADGGVAFGGSKVRPDSSPVVKGPGDEYTANRETLYCFPGNAKTTRVRFMCMQ